MDYPPTLKPHLRERIRLPSGKEIEVPKTEPLFKAWEGAPPDDTYGGKPLIDFKGRCHFAEETILSMLQEVGWDGVWVDNYRGRFRCGEPPSKQKKLLHRVQQRAGIRGGCFDVYCWKGDAVLFAEVKRKGKDRMRPSQCRWLQAAIDCKLPLDSFLIVEWSISDQS